eukprot:5829642-Prymnesium_polylepis.1
MLGRGGTCVGECFVGCSGLGAAPSGAFTLMFSHYRAAELVRVASVVRVLRAVLGVTGQVCGVRARVRPACARLQQVWLSRESEKKTPYNIETGAFWE